MAAASVMVLLEESDCSYILNTSWKKVFFFLIPRYKPLWNEVGFPQGSGRKGLGMLFGGGEAVLLHWGSPSCCSPPAWQELSLSNTLPPNTEGPSLFWLVLRTITPSPSVPIVAAKPGVSVLGTSRPSTFPCQHHTVLWSLGRPALMGTTGYPEIQSQRFAGRSLMAQLRAPSPHPARIWSVTLTNRGVHQSPVTGLFTPLSWAD